MKVILWFEVTTTQGTVLKGQSIRKIELTYQTTSFEHFRPRALSDKT